MGRLKLEGWTRERAASVLLVVALFGGVWRLGLLDELSGTGSGGGGGGPGPDLPEVTRSGSEDDEKSDGDGGLSQELDMGDYDPGDCIFYRTNVVGSANTHLVDCTEDHRMQVTSQVDLDFESNEYPAAGEWTAAIQDKCAPAAEDLLGHPLDPYGRFAATAITPTVEGWDDGDRSSMWCGIGARGSLDGTDGDDDEEGGGRPLFAEDVRDADQTLHHPAGTCLANVEDSERIVDCSEPHHREVTGEIDLTGRSERPVGAQERALGDDCHAEARAYLGTDPAAPWSSGYETLAEESWAAGARSIHCFLGQWDPSEDLVEVTGSAKG
jgi:hypothetical protein